MDCREDRRLHQTTVGESHEIVMAVDEVELGSVFERLGDVEVLGHFRVDGAVLFVPAVDYGMQTGTCDGIAGGE